MIPRKTRRRRDHVEEAPSTLSAGDERTAGAGGSWTRRCRDWATRSSRREGPIRRPIDRLGTLLRAVSGRLERSSALLRRAAGGRPTKARLPPRQRRGGTRRQREFPQWPAQPHASRVCDARRHSIPACKTRQVAADLAIGGVS